MSKMTELKKRAFLVMSDMAFIEEKDANGLPILLVVNLNKLNQIMRCSIQGEKIRLKSTNMSETNKFKLLLYIERNKNLIIKHFGVTQ